MIAAVFDCVALCAMMVGVSLAAPIALLLLVPWGALVVWMLRGRGALAGVPYLPLWPARSSSATSRSRRLPPWWVVVALLALLVAILGLTGPQVGRRVITVVVDRGLTMPPQRRAEALATLPNDRAFEFVLVPGGADVSRDVAATSPAVPWVVDLSDAVRDEPDALFLTDQPVAGPRLPLGAIDNLGIAHVGVGDGVGDGEAVIRLRGRGRATVRLGDATLDVDGAGELVLPLPPDADRWVARLEGEGPITADNAFWLVREMSPPRLVADATVDPAVARFAAIWTAERGGEGVPVRLTTDLDADPPAIVFGQAPFAELPNGELAIQPGLLTEGIRWQRWLDRQRIAAMPAGFEPVVSVGGRPVLGVAAGRVWIGLDPATAAGEPDWVVLLANAVTKLAGAERWTSEPIVADLPTPDATVDANGYSPLPGIYRIGGRRLAFNAEVADPRGVGGTANFPAGRWEGRGYRRPLLWLASGLWAAALVGAFGPRRSQEMRRLG